jgi:uncharacterized protein (DUF58 family)
MDFVDVRAYQPGDDIRVIDWNVSARLDDLYIKQFVEERELTVFLLVDASGSQLFGTQSRRKQECAAELGALIAFSAIKNNDRVGLITFTDKIETFIPPKKGRKHVLRVITEILEQRTTARGTDISAALEHLSRITRKKAVVFLISDFQDEGFEKALNISSRRHEIVPIFLIDPMEEKLPNMGIIQVENPETGELLTVDTTSKKIRDAYEYAATAQREAREKAFRKRKIDHVVVRTDEDYLAPLLKYFRLRARRA